MCKYCGDQHVILELKDLHILTDKKLEKAVDILNKATGERLYVDPGKAMAEISPYKAVRDLELRSKIRVELLLFDLYTQIDNKWLHVVKAIDNTPFKIGNKTFLNPRSGKSLTKTEWKQIKADLMKAFGYIYGKEEERIVKVAMALGKILNQMPVPDAIVTPFTAITLDVKVPAETDAYQNALNFAEEYTAQLITSVTERQYTKIHDVILTAQKNRFSTGQLSATLFDTFGDMNKDWRRIAETEIANNVNNGQLITELNRSKEEYVFMKGVSSPDACAWCASKVNNNIVILMDLPPEDGTDRMVVDGKTYTVIWPGKDNVGRIRKNWWVSAGTQHPHTYAKDTDVMTDNGWKRFYDLNKTDKIMAINPKTKEIDFVEYVNYVEHYQEQMVYLHGRNFDLKVTPEHRQLYLSHKTGLLKERAIKDLIMLNNFDLPRAVGEWQGKYIKQWGLSEEVFIKLWAWFISDGSAGVYNGYFRVNILQKDNTNIKKDLGDLISASGCISARIKEMFREYVGVKANMKYLPMGVKSVSKQGMRWFIEAYSKADGHNRKGKSLHSTSYQSKTGKRTDDINLYTTSVRLMNDLSEMIIKAGYIPSVIIQKPSNKLLDFPNGQYKSNYDVYILHVCKSKYRRFDKHNDIGKIDIVEYNDIAYDVELEKWHHLLVRRNGKVAWSGNCRCSWIKYTPGFEDWHDKLSEAIAQATRETQDAIIPEFIMDEEPLFIQEMRAKQVLKNQ